MRLHVLKIYFYTSVPKTLILALLPDLLHLITLKVFAPLWALQSVRKTSERKTVIVLISFIVDALFLFPLFLF